LAKHRDLSIAHDVASALSERNRFDSTKING